MGAIRGAIDAWKASVDAQGGPTKETLVAVLPELDPEHVKNTERLLAMGMLMGMDHVVTDLNLSDPVDLARELEPVSFDQAIRAFKSRISMTKAEWNKLEPKLRFRAFTVARLGSVEAIEKARSKLLETLEKSGSLTEFWEAQSLHKIAGVPAGSPDYWETVYRTNLQTAYNTGRAIQLKETNPEYLEFVGIVDERQSTICNVRSSIVLPATHPFWAANWPPLHFKCRTTIRGVSREEVDAIKSTNPTWERTPDNLLPIGDDLKGFGQNPIDTGTWWKPVPSMVNRAKSLGLEKEFSAIAKEILAPESYALVFNPKTGGFVDLGMSHGKNEAILNLETAQALAESGFKVKLLNVDNKAKNPDAFFEMDGKRWEFKHPAVAGKGSIDRAIREGKDQADALVIRPLDTNGTALDSFRSTIKERVRRSPKLQELIVIWDGVISRFLREDILAWK